MICTVYLTINAYETTRRGGREEWGEETREGKGGRRESEGEGKGEGRESRREREKEGGRESQREREKEGGRLAHWHFDEGEGEGGAEESIHHHGNSLSHVYL